MANTEDIEAKLCAYVDGELDAAGIAEIERHLATNPQHRRLIEDLMETRTLLRELPRAVAPADLVEALHSQLERSALLGEGTTESADVILRIGHWQQIKAIAAVVVLAVGLAAILYYILPSPQQPGTEIAFKPSPTQPSFAGAAGDTARDTSATSTVVVSDGSPDSMSVAPSRAAPALAGGVPSPNSTVSNVLGPNDLLLQQALQNAGAIPRNTQPVTLVVQIDTFHPAGAFEQVRDHLARNMIRIDSLPTQQLPATIELHESQTGWTSRQRHQLVTPQREIESADREPHDQSQPPVQAPGSVRAEDQIVIARHMSRAEIEALCTVVSDPTIGQHARLIDDSSGTQLTTDFALGHPPTEVTPPRASARMELTLLDSDDRDNSTTERAPAPVEIPGLPHGFALSFPTTTPSDHNPASLGDERMDVLIVIRAAGPPTTAPVESR